MTFTKADLINANERFIIGSTKPKQKVDAITSKAVGKKVLINNPILIKLVAKYKGNKPDDSKKPDDLMKNEAFVKELKKAFN